MSNCVQALRGWWRNAGLLLPLLAGIAFGASRPAAAHDLLGTFIQHGVHLSVGARHIDLTLDLTFFEEWSARERTAMDADADGHISRTETESYLKKLAPRLSRQVKLQAAGSELELVPLYDPEIDLLAHEKVGPAHHRLRIFFFAPTPKGLRTGDEILVEDRLWPEARFLATPQAEGRDGCTVTTEIRVDPDRKPAQTGGGRLFKFRCVKPPPANTTAPIASNPRLRESGSGPRRAPQAPPQTEPRSVP